MAPQPRTVVIVVAELVVVVALVALAGCTTTRSLTPWLRVRSTVSFERGFIAESGGAGPRTTAVVERDDGRAWVRVDADDFAGFGFAHDTRAVLGTTLYFDDGRTEKLDCTGDLRAVPSGDELLCVDRAGDRVRVTRFDRDGRQLARRTVPPPVQRAANAVLGDDVDVHFLGFLESGGLAFSVFVTRSGDSFAAGTPVHCRGFTLRDDDAWSEGPELATTTDALWECNFPRPWRERLRWPVQDGARGHDAYGQPNP